VLHVAYDHQIFAVQRVGGISRYFVELAARLHRRPGCRASVVAPLHINLLLDTLPPGVVAGRRVRAVPRTARLRLALSRALADRALRRRPPTLVHETYFDARPSGPRGLPRVLTVYDMIAERYQHDAATARAKRAAARRADHVICISERTRQDFLEDTGHPPERASVVYLGCTLRPVVGSPAPAAVPPWPYLLYVGERGAYKNFARLLAALARSRHFARGDVGLYCLGGGPFTAAERDGVAALPAGGRVAHRSGGDDVLAAAYAGAAALVYPSVYEGFGIPPLEAMAAGCPVLASTGGSIPEVVGPAARYFDPLNVDAMSSAIDEALDDPAALDVLRALGRERATHFSWDDCASRTLDVYARLTA
jgi:glycosyltransferase involved in cell wall biosynthesis